MKKIIIPTLFLIISTLAAVFWHFYSISPKIVHVAPAKSNLFKIKSYKQLSGWTHADVRHSLETFKVSCKAFLKQHPEKMVGTFDLKLQAKDWQPVCFEALKYHFKTKKQARAFFEEWFIPVEFSDEESGPGLFTGYYVPTIKGSLIQSKKFSVPLYQTPSDLIRVDLGSFFPELAHRKIFGRIVQQKLVPYYTREQINKGAIQDKAKVLVWINSPIDRLFLEIQGSGLIELEDGSMVSIGYDAQNGLPYTAIAAVLIKRGVMTRDNASMQAIKHYLLENPQQMHEVIDQNKSFIFFRTLAANQVLGAQGVNLTPGYSLAVDRQWIPLGVPLWLNTSKPHSKSPELNVMMQRLMIAQDTGGAIRGKIRGDVFWGGGHTATVVAGHMKNAGHYSLLLPRHSVDKWDAHANRAAHVAGVITASCAAGSVR